MTPAELKTTREALGLPTIWLAQQAKVNDRTVNRWESGIRPIPQEIIDIIIEAKRVHDEMAHQTLRFLQDASVDHPDAEPVLYRYRTDEEFWNVTGKSIYPATFHARVLFEVQKRSNVAVRIEWKNPEK